ncbi:hypothetical protein KJ068_24350 [bacterium]|nr:hypothetical protein [bacterium]
MKDIGWGKVVLRMAVLYCPKGTCDNSPPIYWREKNQKISKVPKGRLRKTFQMLSPFVFIRPLRDWMIYESLFPRDESRGNFQVVPAGQKAAAAAKTDDEFDQNCPAKRKGR